METVATPDNELPDPPVKPSTGRLRESREWLLTAAIAIVIVMLLNLFVFNLSTVKGHSMQPTLMESQHLFVNKFIYNFTEPAFGDVVILRDPSREVEVSRFLVKRIVGAPGDTIQIEHDRLYINGKEQAEPYIDTNIEDGNYGPLHLGPGKFFVMGDNRHAGSSKDSRYFGSVTASDLVGRAELIFWPLSDCKWL